MSKYTIALYIRLSVEDEKTESLSIENQRFDLTEYAKTLKNGENVDVLEFVDNGYTGTNFERPAVQELLELVQTGKIHCVIVKDFTRFGRNLIETGYFLERVFPVFGTRFISINDNFDTYNYKEDTGGLDVAFKYLLGEYYSKDLSQKSKTAKYLKMKNGEYQSKICCYGYKKGANGRMEIDENVAPNVRLIFDMAANGQPTREIVKTLFDKKIPTPGEYKAANGNKNHDVSKTMEIWQHSTILRILDDERYIGTYVMGKRTLLEVGGKSFRLKDESEWYKIPDHHHAIVEKAVFEKVKSQARRFSIDKKTPKNEPLKGKIFCGCCNHSMQKLRNSPFFHCKYTRVNESADCHKLKIHGNEIESMLYDIISKQAEIILSTDNLQNVGISDERLAQKLEYEKLIEDCFAQKQYLYERYALREISKEDYIGEKFACDNELKSLRQIYSMLSSETAQMQADSIVRQNMLDMANVVAMETMLTSVIVDMLVKRVSIFPGDNVEIEWAAPDFLEVR